MQFKVERARLIDRLSRFPGELESVVRPLTEEILNARAEHDPWTIAQIIHHCADSHMNSFIRLKLVLTEDRPPLKGYDQDRWAEMADECSTPIESSLTILRGLHQRWVVTFRNIDDDDWSRVGIHSEIGEVSVTDLLTTYTVHCDEHLDQIQRILAAVEC